MEQNQSQEATPVKEPPLDDASLRPKKRERTEEDLTPKSEQAEVKDEQEEEDSSEELPTIAIRAPQTCSTGLFGLNTIRMLVPMMIG